MTDQPDTINGELWEPVADFPGYSVSSFGRVFSHPRKCRSRSGKSDSHDAPGTGIIMKLTSRYGYPTAHLRRDGKNYPLGVHTLVCAAFHGSRPDGSVAAHLDGSRNNARKENLAWVTPRVNMGHMVEHGTRRTGERHWVSKISDADVAALRDARGRGEHISAVARRFGISESHAYRLAAGTHRPL